MAEAPEHAAATATITEVLGQVVTMRAESISFECHGEAGCVARVMVSGGGHEILCELNAEGDLISARVIER